MLASFLSGRFLQQKLMPLVCKLQICFGSDTQPQFLKLGNWKSRERETGRERERERERERDRSDPE